MKWPRRCTRSTRSHSCSDMVKIIRSRSTPALFMTMSSPPNELTAALIGLDAGLFGHNEGMAATRADTGTPVPATSEGRPMAIDVQGLHKSFGQVRAVQGV